MADPFRIERSTTIAAPAEKILPFIDDFHAWASWSPWEKLDPAMKKTYSGAARGKGATYAWAGNRKAGSGAMEITESSPSKIVIALNFTAPMRAQNTAEFTLAPDGAGTRVTWAMTGMRPFIMKIMGLFMNFDEMVGKDFDAGLAALKSLAEK